MPKFVLILLCFLPGVLSADRDERRLLKSWGLLEDPQGELRFALPQTDSEHSERWTPDLSDYQRPAEIAPHKTMAPVVLSPESSTTELR